MSPRSALLSVANSQPRDVHFWQHRFEFESLEERTLLTSIIVDNSQTDLLSLTGNWSTGSGTPGFVGSDYLHDRNGGKGSKSVTYQPTVPAAGDYEVLLYWSSQSNRASNVPVDVLHADGITTVLVNQRQDGNRWNSLGTFRFEAGRQDALRIRNDQTNGFVIADAIQLVSSIDTTAPSAMLADPARSSDIATSELNARGYFDIEFTDIGSGIDPASITDAAAEFTLSGAAATGVTVDGAAVALGNNTYRYSFSGTFGLGTVTVNYLSGSWTDRSGNLSGTHTGTFEATALQANLEVDNSDAANVTVVGSWFGATGVTGYIGANFLSDGNGGKGSKSVTYFPTVADAGTYEVFLNWTSKSNRASNVPVDIFHADGTSTVVVNQRLGGAQWQSLGAFRFDPGRQGALRIRNDGTNGVVVADAMRLVSSVDLTAPSAELANPEDGGSIAATQLNSQGYLEVAFPDVGSGVDGATITDSAAEFTLSGSAASGVVVNGAGVHVSGDTYRYSFTGTFGLGAVTVNFGSGAWADNAGNTNSASSNSFTTTTIQPNLEVDNSDVANLNLVGSWSGATGVTGYIGTNFLTDGNAGKGSKSVTYFPTIADAGTYEVFLNWTSKSNRASNAPVDIFHADGTSTVVVNQRLGGAQWQSLGVFRFDPGRQGALRIRNDGTNGVVVADAMRLVSSVDLTAPSAELVNPEDGGSIAATQLNAQGYLEVAFPDVGSGVDGATITDSAAEFTLSGSAASGVVVNGAGVHVAGDTYRYSFTGTFGLGAVTVNFGSGAWADNAGNTNSASSSSFTTTTIQPNLEVDNSDVANLNVVGSWSGATGVTGYIGTNFLTDGNAGKGTKSVTYFPTVADAGTYEVFLNWTSKSNRASNVPVDIFHADGTSTVVVNQRLGGAQWQSLGVFRFDPGRQGALRIRNDGTNGVVVADAMRLVSNVDLTAPSAATLVDPASSGTIPATILNARGYMDIDFADVGSGIDASSITDNAAEFTLSGSAASGVSVNGAGVHVSGDTYRYSFTGTFGLGAVTVNFASGSWEDQSGNTNQGNSGTFTTTTLQPDLEVDNTDVNDLSLVGGWVLGSGTSGFIGVDYLHDNNTEKGTKSVTYLPTIADAGAYEVFLRWTSRWNRATNVPVDIVHADGTTTVIVNQRQDGGQWMSLGIYRFEIGREGVLRIRNDGTDGLVIADAMKLERAYPRATLANPTNGGSIPDATLNNRGYIDVTFTDPGGTGLNAASILDAAAEFTLSGSAASGVTVSGTPTLVSGLTYRYTFTGSFGVGDVTVTYVSGGWQDVNGASNVSFTETFRVASPYNIQIIYPDNTLSASQKLVFQQAAERWSELIVADIPDVFVSGYGTVDDLVIEATGPSIDGPGGILGSAGPTALRTGSYLPAYGRMRFDSADLASLESSGQLFGVIIHEMAHVIGYGTIWSHLGLLSGAGTSNPRYLGSNAIAEYRSIFGTSETTIPIEAGGGSGTRDAHWRESVFGNELMTGWLNAGSNPISRITVAQFADLGYSVNLAAADAYTPPGNVLQGTSGTTTGTSSPALRAAIALPRAIHAGIVGGLDLPGDASSEWEFTSATVREGIGGRVEDVPLGMTSSAGNDLERAGRRLLFSDTSWVASLTDLHFDDADGDFEVDDQVRLRTAAMTGFGDGNLGNTLPHA